MTKLEAHAGASKNDKVQNNAHGVHLGLQDKMEWSTVGIWNRLPCNIIRDYFQDHFVVSFLCLVRTVRCHENPGFTTPYKVLKRLAH